MPPGVDKQHPSLPRYDAPSDVIRYSNRTGFETPTPQNPGERFREIGRIVAHSDGVPPEPLTQST